MHVCDDIAASRVTIITVPLQDYVPSDEDILHVKAEHTIGVVQTLVPFKHPHYFISYSWNLWVHELRGENGSKPLK